MGVIRLRAGRRETMPVLADREVAYVRDEQALYIGTPDGNVKVADAGTGAKVEKMQQEKLTASPMAALDALSEDADLPAVAAAYNSLIAALKAAGMMN